MKMSMIATTVSLSVLTFCSRSGARDLRYPSSDFSRSGTGSRGSLFWFENVLG
jgi:hypothetical protein